MNQTYKDFEFIIIDDNPENNALKEYLANLANKDSRVVLIFNESNIGLTNSLNKGLEVAKGVYIARMDADDLADRERFAKQVNRLESREHVGLCHTNYCIIDERGIIQQHYYLKKERTSKEWLVWTNPIAHSTVMFRSSLVKLRSPLYNESRRSAQDYDLWSLFSLHNVIFDFINEELLQYRVSSRQVSKIRHSEQSKNFYEIRRQYIRSLLYRYAIIEHEDITSVEVLINRIETSNYKSSSNDKQRELDLILYRLYYTASGDRKVFIWRYFFSKTRVFTRFNLRMNTYMILQLVLKNHWPAYLF